MHPWRHAPRGTAGGGGARGEGGGGLGGARGGGSGGGGGSGQTPSATHVGTAAVASHTHGCAPM